MIVREETSNINTKSPTLTTAWEKFYSYCWRTHISRPTATNQQVSDALSSELAQYNASLEYRPNIYKSYKVTFADDKEYTLFVLRWS